MFRNSSVILTTLVFVSVASASPAEIPEIGVRKHVRRGGHQRKHSVAVQSSRQAKTLLIDPSGLASRGGKFSVRASGQFRANSKQEHEQALGLHRRRRRKRLKGSKVRNDLDGEAPMIIHHLRNKEAFAIGNQILDQENSSATPRVFCYAFVMPPEDGGPEAQVKEIRNMLGHCDGSALFSNYNDSILGITKAHDGRTGGNAHSSVQFLSVYELLAHSDDLQDRYDWFVDLESDHFVRSKLMKPLLARQNARQAIMLTNMNVRVLSSGLLREMKRQWDVVGKRRGDRCPKWAEHPVNCQGDVTLSMLPAIMEEGTARHALLGGTFFDLGRLGKGWRSGFKQQQQMRKFLKNEQTSELTQDSTPSCLTGYLERLQASRASARLTKRMSDVLEAIIADVSASCAAPDVTGTAAS